MRHTIFYEAACIYFSIARFCRIGIHGSLSSMSSTRDANKKTRMKRAKHSSRFIIAVRRHWKEIKIHRTERGKWRECRCRLSSAVIWLTQKELGFTISSSISWYAFLSLSHLYNCSRHFIYQCHFFNFPIFLK